MTSRISYNIRGQFVKNWPRLFAHLQKIKPAAVLVMDAVARAREIKAMLPDTLVISRIYPDEDIQNRMTPEVWMDKRAPQAEGGIWQYTSNEAGFGPNLINWHIRLIELAVQRRVPLVIGNMSVGTPNPIEWAAGRKLLELLDQHRDLVILGLHEYACGVITSGFLGGYPDNAGVVPGSDKKGLNLIQPDRWPSSEVADTITMFHCGRFRLLVNYCNAIHLRPPRIILTEHGFDDVSDIKLWSDRLHMTAPYVTIRGWKSVQNQWRDWFSSQGWSPERAMFEQLAYADRTIYQNSPVEAQLVFTWTSDEDKDWEQFNVSGCDEFQKLLEGYAAAPVTTLPSSPAPIIINPPIPLDIGTGVTIEVKDGNPPWVMRSEPSTQSQQVGYLKNKEKITLYPATAFVNGGYNWHVVVRQNAPSNEAKQGWTIYPLPKPEQPEIQPQLPPPANETPQPIPNLQTFMIPIKLRIEAATEEAASLLARHYASKMDSEFQQLRIDAELHKCIDQIKSVRVLLEFPKEEQTV